MNEYGRTGKGRYGKGHQLNNEILNIELIRSFAPCPALDVNATCKDRERLLKTIGTNFRIGKGPSRADHFLACSVLVLGAMMMINPVNSHIQA